MCGLIGVVTSRGGSVSVGPEVLGAACDALAHRGPDGAGVWRDRHVALAHRRLAVIELSDAGAQPLLLRTPGGSLQLALAYNGELYNDGELRAGVRAGMESRGEHFASHSDTETLGRAFLAYGPETPRHARGMYAFAAYDPCKEVLTLARDPLGIKPLYWARWRVSGTEEVAVASEVSALVALVAAATGSMPRPDLATASAYLTTIRTTLGDRTLFQGVRAVEPGQWIEIDLKEKHLPARIANWWDSMSPTPRIEDPEYAATIVRECLEDSVHRHLRSDVPVCTLLSGGLDSSITTCLARREKPDLLTFAAGAASGPGVLDDLSAARECAAFFSTRHHEAIVDETMFLERWAWMVDRIGLPLSTANEVAINQVARTLRSRGCTVTLSGEGADELFAGYDQALDASAEYVERGGNDPGAYELEHLGWVPWSAKAALMREDAWRGLEQDAALTSYYRSQFSRVQEECGKPDPLAAALRWQRKINLVGLLQRLDTATMLEGVEGRTPFADVRVLEVADSLAMTLKFARKDGASPDAVRTKLILRRAFKDVLPTVALQRPKASFPLPFPQWMNDAQEAVAQTTSQSALLRELFRDECIQLVGATPGAAWRIAWPMMNLAMWEKRWW